MTKNLGNWCSSTKVEYGIVIFTSQHGSIKPYHSNYNYESWVLQSAQLGGASSKSK